MKIKNLDGTDGYLDIRPSQFPLRSEGSSKSKLQYECGQKLKQLFPFHVILEEIAIPRERLFIDFFIPTLRIAVEVHGVQHDKFVKHFHGSKAGFKASQERDSRKKEWCRVNNIELYEVYTPEDLS